MLRLVALVNAAPTLFSERYTTLAQRLQLIDKARNAKDDVASLPGDLWGCRPGQVDSACPLSGSRDRSPVRYYANDGLDYWLYRNFFCDMCGSQRNRSFVELGALDGIKASNTK